MNGPTTNDRSGEDLLFYLLVGVLAAGSIGHWFVGNLAALIGRGRFLGAGISEALVALSRLSDHWDDPRRAWGEPAVSNLPGPVVYWFSAVVTVAAVVTVVVWAMSRVSDARHEPADRRRRVGVDVQPRLAKTQDLRPLLTNEPEPGRFLIARWRRRYLSTEAEAYGRRRGVRGAVAVFGPSQSGKTTGLMAGVEAWDGPAIVSSVKADLMRASWTKRSAAGDVKVFDPLGINGQKTATWSPLRGARELKGALAAAQMLARAGGDDGPHDRFWRGQAEQLIAAMLWTAANTEGHSMRNVVKWVLELDRPEGDNSGTLAPLVRLLTDHPNPNTAMAARQVQGWLGGQWKTDPRTTSSVYATARNAVWPWADPDIEKSAGGCDITIDWLLDGANTLYLCAPLGDETRIGSVFAVLLHDLVSSRNLGLYGTTWDAVVIDEYHFGAWRDAARDLYLPGDPKEDFGEGDTSEKKAIETPDVGEDFDRAGLEAALELEVDHFLYLSGTPFRALTQGEFLEDQVYNWTYSDEQRAKVTWDDSRGPNPYVALPKMLLLTYEMPEALKEVALNNFSEFSLTEFFRTHPAEEPNGMVGAPTFIHEAQVQKWLDLLRGQDIAGLWGSVSSQVKPPLPYEDKNLLEALQHTIWYLPGVSACVAMRDLLARPNNVFFHDYGVVVAAGAAAGMGALALPPVEQKIGKTPQTTKTITLSCGKLMTGVTVPAWAAILMLRELKSPETYFQAAFRVQSPWTSNVVDTIDGGTRTLVYKNHCYVIDFSPNRALTQIVAYGTKLGPQAASAKDNEKAIAEFMEFLPVLSFDGYSMQQLSAAAVLDYMTTGISSSMLARRWNSPELVTLNFGAMEAILANTELLDSLEDMPQFRNITNDLTAMISSNKELGKKKATKEKLSEDEKEQKKEATDKRATLREKLRRFLTRVPAFMYLTDDREKSVKDVISQLEPGLFEKVTGLRIEQFSQLVDAGAFDNSKMNDAVWKFRAFEEPSLRYGTQTKLTDTVGGWSVARDARLASMIDRHLIAPGAVLTDETGTLTAVITEDYGVAVEGIRYDTPDVAARVATRTTNVDGWTFWRTTEGYTLDDLGELAGT